MKSDDEIWEALPKWSKSDPRVARVLREAISSCQSVAAGDPHGPEYFLADLGRAIVDMNECPPAGPTVKPKGGISANVTVEVDSSQVDVAIEKLRVLVELQERVRAPVVVTVTGATGRLASVRENVDAIVEGMAKMGLSAPPSVTIAGKFSAEALAELERGMKEVG